MKYFKLGYFCFVCLLFGEKIEIVENKKTEQIIIEQNMPKEWQNGIGMQFVLIPSGEFRLGCGETETICEDNETPGHVVRITNFFYMGKYEVTQGQWKSIMGDNPSYFDECGDNCPVDSISWKDTQEFILKLNMKESSVKYRLPTEAEWEYAARSGTTTKYYWGEDMDENSGWYANNSERKTHPVGMKKPNGFGLFDISGNVWEWCSDWFSDIYYLNSPKENPKGFEFGRLKVAKGGSWHDEVSPNARTSGYAIRHAYRNRGNVMHKSPTAGFRLVAEKY